MLHKKDGFPEGGETVLCTVKKILHNSVFVTIDEYTGNKEGIIHISEIAPGRIRSIREYVREGKKIICVVLRINRERGNIELSLRRVTKSMHLRKSEDLKLENKCEKILEMLAIKHKKNINEIYTEVGLRIISKYGSLHEGFKECYDNGEKEIVDVVQNNVLVKDLAEAIKVRLKPAEVKISRMIVLRNKGPEGIETIKGILTRTLDIGKKEHEEIEFTYMGAPQYRITIRSTDYKKAQAGLDKISEAMQKEASKSGSTFELKK